MNVCAYSLLKSQIRLSFDCKQKTNLHFTNFNPPTNRSFHQISTHQRSNWRRLPVLWPHYLTTMSTTTVAIVSKARKKKTQTRTMPTSLIVARDVKAVQLTTATRRGEVELTLGARSTHGSSLWSTTMVFANGL